MNIQQKIELKEFIRVIARIKRDIFHVAAYLFSNRGIEFILQLYKRLDDFKSMGSETKRKEILNQIKFIAYVIYVVVEKAEKDPEFKHRLSVSVPEFDQNFKRLKDWITKTGISKSAQELKLWMQNNEKLLIEQIEKNIFLKELEEVYKKEVGE